MKHFKRLLACSLAVVMAGSILVACGGSSTGSSEADDSSAETTEADAGSGEKLVMATNATFPPYEYVEGGEYEGIDVEIAGKIAEKLGRELEIQDVEFDSIIGGVQSGKYDMGMAGMTVTEERKQSVNFTDSYASGIQSIIVPEGSAIATVDDLSSDTRIGVQQGTTGDIYATDDYGDGAVTAYKNGADAVQALLTDKIDCVIIDNEPAKSFVEANEGLTILDTSYAEEDYAICISKDNEDLLTEINDALSELKADGTIDEIIGKYITAE
ncbi:MAG: transporter substrate-binding domain-containing protein [Lachnospiraceae bacterium]|nr:transporter substrate-binding domain-containing protein [Lachnospiraceae bacterium]